jgi:hypothetical protein
MSEETKAGILPFCIILFCFGILPWIGVAQWADASMPPEVVQVEIQVPELPSATFLEYMYWIEQRLDQLEKQIKAREQEHKSFDLPRRNHGK